MKKNYILQILTLLMLGFLISCNIQNKRIKEIPEIAVTWQYKGIKAGTNGPSLAIFTLKNMGGHKLGPANWKLYFNQAPRPLIKGDSNNLALVEHINGDYYKLIPTDKFSLKPGDSIQISYEFEWVMINETDAPRGLYFVFYDRKGKELAIKTVNNYRIKPFNLSVNNLQETANAAQQYRKNETLKVLPENEWQRLIPKPVKIIENNSVIKMDSTYNIVADESLQNEAVFLCELLKSEVGINLKNSKTITGNKNIILRQKSMSVNGISDESYKITITGDKIEIAGNDPAGVFYGIQSFVHLLPIDGFGKKKAYITIPCLTIEDSPRFQYRGLHIDVCRHFQPKKEILKMFDLMAFYKLNKLHLVLTEDEGWRIEIKELPELTQIGSRRGHSQSEDKMLNPAYGSGPDPDDSTTFGSGYYSRKDFIEIIKYAHKRHIQVIPGINFPGHARAAIKSMEARYNRLIKEKKPEEANKYRLINPDDTSVFNSAQFYYDNVVNVSLESVYSFYKKVVDEIADMYKEADVPFTSIHTGGDEVPAGAWTGSPSCTILMQNLQLKDSKDLQAYFFGRILKILEKHKLTAGGWEEIALNNDSNGKIKVNNIFSENNVVPYVWNNLEGSEDLGYRLANAGYPVVLCCATNFYLDMAYNSNPLEPGLYWAGFTDEYDPWIAAPYNLTGKNKSMVSLVPDAMKNILGLQAQLWSETIVGSEMLEYYVLPKLISFAERAWAQETSWENMTESSEKTRQTAYQWNQFINRVSHSELPRLNELFGGYNYRVPPPAVWIEKGMMRINCQYQGLNIHYTTDGSEPDQNSSKFTFPFEVFTEVKAITIDKAGKKSRTVTSLPANFNNNH